MSLRNTNNNSLAEEDVSGLPRENSSVSFVEFEVDGHAVSREGAIRGTCDGPVDLRGSTTATSSKSSALEGQTQFELDVEELDIPRPRPQISPRESVIDNAFVIRQLQLFTTIFDDTPAQTPRPEGQTEDQQCLILPTDVPDAQRNRRAANARRSRESGNNQFGRSGNLRCAQCRKRKGKCIYLHEWLPCEYCRKRKIEEPCVKLGPDSVISRQLPTAIDAVIRSEDALLLQGAYALEASGTASFLKQLAIIYGTPMPHTPLRHAIIAYATTRWESPHFRDQLEFHQMKATNALIKRLQTSKFDDSDVFAAFMLAWIAFNRLSRDESAIHVNGCMKMLDFLVENIARRPLSDALIAFQPYVLDRVFLISSTVPGVSFPERKTTLAQRIRYYELLCQTGTPLEGWLTGAVSEAVHDHLGDMIVIGFHWLDYVVNEQYANRQPGERVKKMIDHIRTAVAHPDLLRTLGEYPIKGVKHPMQGMLFEYQFKRLQCIELLLSIIDAPCVFERLKSTEISRAGKRSLATLRAQPKVEMFQFYDGDYPAMLTLAGMTLTPRDDPELLGWIVQELEERKRSQLAEDLQRWWGSWEYDELLQIMSTLVRVVTG